MFEIKTLILLNLIVSFSFAVLQLLDLGWTTKLAARENISTNLLHFTGFSLVLLHPYIGVFWSIVAANQILLLSYLFLIKTTFKLFNISFSKKFFVVFSVFLFMVFLIHWLANNKPSTENVFLTAIIFLLIIYTVLRILYSFVIEKSKLHVVFILFFLALALVYALRFFYSIVQFKDSISFLDNNKINTFYIVSLSLFIFVWNYSIQLKRNSIFRSHLNANVKELCKTNEDVSILNSLFYQGEVQNMSDLYEEIFDLLKKRFLIEKCSLYLFDYNSNSLKVVSIRGITSSAELEIINNLSNQKYSLSYEAFLSQEIKSISTEELPYSTVKDVLLDQNICRLISFPLTYSGNCLGVLTLGIEESSNFIEDQMFLSICKQLSGVIYNSQIYDELIHTRDKLKEMATTDHLTGIINRREFLSRYEAEFAKSRRHGDCFTLFMVDLDDFKQINDNYGHDVGDLVLISVVNTIKNSLRSSDIFARYGGEEFIGVLVKSNPEGGVSRLQEIVKEVSQVVIPDYPDINITISVGSCNYYALSNNSVEIIKKADIALYKAKKAGKNRICATGTLPS